MPSILTRHAPLRPLEHALRIYFHIYMRLRGVRCGALGYWRGYVNFSVKIHFVIMDFPCRIRRSRRRRRCLHDKYNLLQGLQLNPPPSTFPSFTTENPAPTPWPLHSSQGDNYLPPASCGAPVLVSGLLGHDRWQVSVGVRMGMVVCSPSSWALESPHPRSSMFSNLDFHPDQNSCGYSANWRCTNCLSQNNPYILGFLLLPNVYYLYIVYFLALNILFIRMLKFNNQLNYQEHQIQSK